MDEAIRAMLKELIDKAFKDGLRAAANGNMEMYNTKYGFISGIRQTLVVTDSHPEIIELAERTIKDMVAMLADLK